MRIIFVPSDSGAATAIATVPDVASLPPGVAEGSIRYVEDIDAIYVYNGATWSIISASVSISGIADTSTVDLDVTLGVLTADVIQSGIDHGNLAGLADDDHPQYLNTTRADTWLATKDTDDLAEGGTNLYYTNARADARIALQKGAANGLATLDAGSKIPSAQLPAIAITDTFVVASQAAMLALSAQTGDVAVRTDLSETFILQGTDPTVLSDWVMLLTPTDAVISVNGQTGAVSLDSDDIVEGVTNLYFNDERAQDAVGTILVDSASVDFTYNDGTPSITAAVLPAGVNHDALQNYDVNDHVDHTSVSIATASGTSGLTGGGTIAATRNLSVDITGTTALGTTADPADELMIYDVSTTSLKKITVAQIGASSNTANIRASEGTGTTTLTASDNPYQVFDLTADRTVQLPTTGVLQGAIYTMEERTGEFSLLVESSNGDDLSLVSGSSARFIALQNTPTTSSHWDISQDAPIVLRDSQTSVALAANDYTTVCSLSIPPGRYLVSGQITLGGQNGVTFLEMVITQGTGSGPFGDVVLGDNDIYVTPQTGSTGTTGVISDFLLDVPPSGGAQTWNLRMYSGGNVNTAYGRLTAVKQSK